MRDSGFIVLIVMQNEMNGVKKSFFGYFTDEDECRKTVKDCYENLGKLIDTHTAVAVCAADKYLKESGSNRPMLVVSTASAYKFAADVLRDLGETCPDNELEAPCLLEKLTGVTMPFPLRSALEKKPIHTRVIKSNEMTREALSFPFS